MEYSLDDFENVICLKNQLLSVPIETLLETYQDYENFITFLDSICVLSDMDSAFLLFDSGCIEKIEAIIQKYRFQYKDPTVVKTINEIIVYLNGVKSLDSTKKDILKEGYLDYHEDCRKITMDDEETFMNSLAYDAVCYAALKDDHMDTIPDDNLFLASVNYLLEAVPQFFKDPDVANRLLTKLDVLEKKGWPFHRTTREYSKETKTYYKKFVLKEE